MHSIGRRGIREALELDGARLLERHLNITHPLDGLPAREDLIGLGLIRDPRRDVDRAPVDVAVAEDHRARLDPDVQVPKSRPVAPTAISGRVDPHLTTGPDVAELLRQGEHSKTETRWMTSSVDKRRLLSVRRGGHAEGCVACLSGYGNSRLCVGRCWSQFSLVVDIALGGTRGQETVFEGLTIGGRWGCQIPHSSCGRWT